MKLINVTQLTLSLLKEGKPKEKIIEEIVKAYKAAGHAEDFALKRAVATYNHKVKLLDDRKGGGR